MQRKRRVPERTIDLAADVASATECTGLLPALPPDDAEGEACAELCAIHRAKSRDGDHRYKD